MSWRYSASNTARTVFIEVIVVHRHRDDWGLGDLFGACGPGGFAWGFGGPRGGPIAGGSLAQAGMPLYGFAPNGFAGTRVTSGDFDCDGFSDMAIGSVG